MTVLFLAYAAVIGLCVGSFLNVVVYRLPKMMQQAFEQEARAILEQPQVELETFNLSHPSSHCPSCNNKIRWWMNIPVFSYLYLRGKCGFCNVGINFRYPAVELFTGLLTFLAAWQSPNLIQFGFLAIAIWLCIALMLIDLDTFLLPDSLTLPLLWLGLIANSSHIFTDLHSAVWGAVIGYMILWSVYWIFKLLMKKEGMGAGDFKLLAAIGAWFGWQALPAVILISAGVGTVIGVTMIMLKKQDSSQHIPFGPYLGMAFLIQIFCGDTINQLLLGG